MDTAKPVQYQRSQWKVFLFVFWYQVESRLAEQGELRDAAKIIINKTEVCQLLNLVCDFDTEHQFRGCLRAVGKTEEEQGVFVADGTQRGLKDEFTPKAKIRT